MSHGVLRIESDSIVIAGARFVGGGGRGEKRRKLKVRHAVARLQREGLAEGVLPCSVAAEVDPAVREKPPGFGQLRIESDSFFQGVATGFVGVLGDIVAPKEEMGARIARVSSGELAELAVGGADRSGAELGANPLVADSRRVAVEGGGALQKGGRFPQPTGFVEPTPQPVEENGIGGAGLGFGDQGVEALLAEPGIPRPAGVGKGETAEKENAASNSWPPPLPSRLSFLSYGLHRLIVVVPDVVVRPQTGLERVRPDRLGMAVREDDVRLLHVAEVRAGGGARRRCWCSHRCQCGGR